METKLAPLAFRHAETTRAAGLALMRGLALVSAVTAALRRECMWRAHEQS